MLDMLIPSAAVNQPPLTGRNLAHSRRRQRASRDERAAFARAVGVDRVWDDAIASVVA